MLEQLKETTKTLQDVKSGVDSLRAGLENGLFDIKDAVKILSRISEKI